MNLQEAKAVMNLKPNDCITMTGLNILESENKALLKQAIGKSEIAQAMKELEAIKVLRGVAK